MSPDGPTGRRVLVARLAGPLQSWGEHSPYTHRGTLPYPTYSGLLGLARASLGSARTADPGSWQWLRGLDMAVRIDVPGSIVRDFHTVNPPPAGAWSSEIGAGKKSAKTTQTPYIVPVGNGRAWAVGNTPSTLITERLYLSDAVFTWLIEGPLEQVNHLRASLERPNWQLSLGRKACSPDWPLSLGTTEGTLADQASIVPIVDPSSAPHHSPWGQRPPEGDSAITRSVELHTLTSQIPASVGVGTTITHTDDPVGSHPHAGHTPRARHVTTVSAPVTDRHGLLAWATAHLDAT